jgi:CAAX prenyl protease-like protein
MPISARADSHIVAGWVCVPFLLVGLLDGYWKIASLHLPLITFWAYDFAKWVLLPIALLALLHRFAIVMPKDYGLSADLGKRDILGVLPFPLFSLFVVVFFTVTITQNLVQLPLPQFTYSQMLAPLGPLWIVGTLYLSVTAGLWESLFFIGLPWLWFSKGRSVSPIMKCGFAGASAILFAASHWENGFANVIGVFLFQLLAVWWFFRLGTLWPVIGAHFLIDVVFFWPPP